MEKVYLCVYSHYDEWEIDKYFYDNEEDARMRKYVLNNEVDPSCPYWYVNELIKNENS